LISGFEAYQYFHTMKHVHFADNDFDVTRCKTLPNRRGLVNKWNREEIDLNGHIFQKINMDNTNRNNMILLFASYWIQTPDFFVRDIIQDKYKTFKDNVSCIKRAEKVFEADVYKVLEYCEKKKITIKKYFYSPDTLYHIRRTEFISKNSIILLNQCLDFFNKLNYDSLNFIEQSKYDYYKVFFKKYWMILKRYIGGIDWKLKLKDILNKEKQRNNKNFMTKGEI